MVYKCSRSPPLDPVNQAVEEYLKARGGTANHLGLIQNLGGQYSPAELNAAIRRVCGQKPSGTPNVTLKR